MLLFQIEEDYNFVGAYMKVSLRKEQLKLYFKWTFVFQNIITVPEYSVITNCKNDKIKHNSIISYFFLERQVYIF